MNLILFDFINLFERIFYRLSSYIKTYKYRLITQSAKNVWFHPISIVINMNKCKDSISLGENTIIKGELLTFKHGGKINIGENCFVGEGSRIWSDTNIIIGNRVLISHNVNIHDNNSHPIDPEQRHLHYKEMITYGHPKNINGLKGTEIVIEDDVWIGFNAVILKGIKIGKGSIIAAGSIVLKDVPPNYIYGGSTNQILKKINKNEH
jgi:acetyltransferase-like isoleucine patch superfamily enzyme